MQRPHVDCDVLATLARFIVPELRAYHSTKKAGSHKLPAFFGFNKILKLLVSWF